GAGQHGGVVEGGPHLVARGGEVGGAGDLHREVSWVVFFFGVLVVVVPDGASAPRRSEGSSPAACRSRSSHSWEGEIGIAVTGKPSASSIAPAMTALTGMHPASPAPLMPSGFSGLGVSRWSASTWGTSEA